jgi:uncharacterized membrane protein
VSDPWDDQAIVARVGGLLRAGVLASAFFIVLGGVIHLAGHGGDRVVLPGGLPRTVLGELHLYRDPARPDVDRSTFAPLPAEFSRPADIFKAALLGRGPAGGALPCGEGRGRALIQLGLLLLIATPVCRVAFSIFAFARQRDWLYVLFPVLVLAGLLLGLFSGYMH